MKPSGGGGGDWLGLGDDDSDSKSLDLSNTSMKTSSSFSNDDKKDTPETQGMVSEFSCASLMRKVCLGTKYVAVNDITTNEIFATADQLAQLFVPVFFGYFRLPPILPLEKYFLFYGTKTCCPQHTMLVGSPVETKQHDHDFITSFSMDYLQTRTCLK